MEFVRARPVSLRNHEVLNERWLQQALIEEPSLLGLGDLRVRGSERRQPGAGRLDLLLYDPDTETRYEVEIQLGAVDESHIIRTIEYWDIERQRYPQFDHVAVIVAENITSRFLNVISLFNRSIPLMAVQLQAMEVGDNLTLVATKVLDLVTLGSEDEDEGETVDRRYWEQKASTESLSIADQLLKEVQQLEPTLQAKYNKHYIGLASRGIARNFVVFKPRKQSVIAEFKIPRDDALSTRLTEAGLDLLGYARWGTYRVRLGPSDLSAHPEVFRELIRLARDAYGS